MGTDQSAPRACVRPFSPHSWEPRSENVEMATASAGQTGIRDSKRKPPVPAWYYFSTLERTRNHLAPGSQAGQEGVERGSGGERPEP